MKNPLRMSILKRTANLDANTQNSLNIALALGIGTEKLTQTHSINKL